MVNKSEKIPARNHGPGFLKKAVSIALPLQTIVHYCP